MRIKIRIQDPKTVKPLKRLPIGVLVGTFAVFFTIGGCAYETYKFIDGLDNGAAPTTPELVAQNR